MTLATSVNPQSIQYPAKTIKRAERALCCSPFNLQLFMVMRSTSVSLEVIANQEGYQHGYCQRPLRELTVEQEFNWLMNVGLVRREVDGQGLTNSFRLTPLGRQLVQKWENRGDSFPTPAWWERLYNTAIRWFRLPF